jgi:hypothetical protein
VSGLFIVFTNPISEDRLEEYLEWYQNDHIPKVLQIPGFVNANVYKASAARPANSDALAKFSYVTIYEVESEDLNESFRFLGEASRAGRFGVKAEYPIAPDSMSCAYELARACVPTTTSEAHTWGVVAK